MLFFTQFLLILEVNIYTDLSMEESEEMLQVMLDKHSRGEEVEVPITLTGAILVSEETVMKQLRGFTRGTSKTATFWMSLMWALFYWRL